ncbi:hypothetical protein PhaeoP18_03563 (plasmid) [Phaeobacter piscinae]|nr:hypothetical protein PhaeoP92_03740 [Phaeobacter inhibens]AUQ80374.1 hypothetical protein PhaeoP74_03741 [Phaeobacter inhibens]AUR17533.1 hypothetical protein PhaeoP70_03739 [Phaeobacter inhibens]AUR37781.1 hypothetical protein PhaeoP18_03563 [Phaeobacter piscinae]
MGHWECTRLASRGNQTPITPSNIYFLDNGFHPLATSQKVCDAWRKQSEQMASWRSSVRWLMHVRMRVSASSSWRRSSNATSRLWHVSKAASVVSTLWSLQFWRGSLALTKMKSCRLSKPPRSPTTKFNPLNYLCPVLDIPSRDRLPRGRAVGQHPPRAAAAQTSAFWHHAANSAP